MDQGCYSTHHHFRLLRTGVIKVVRTFAKAGSPTQARRATRELARQVAGIERDDAEYLFGSTQWLPGLSRPRALVMLHD